MRRFTIQFSPSRLNVAKAGIASILSNYIADADFALMDYQTSALNSWMTWVYPISPAGNVIHNIRQRTARRQAAVNPCYRGEYHAPLSK